MSHLETSTPTSSNETRPGDDTRLADGPTAVAARDPQRKRRGFTLVELMVVVVILGSLIALVGPNVWQALFSSRVELTKAQLANFGDAITTYKLTNKKLPGSLEELTETTDKNPHPILETIPQDAWGNDFEFRNLGRNKYKITSGGEDGEIGTEDDIVFPEEKD